MSATPRGQDECGGCKLCRKNCLMAKILLKALVVLPLSSCHVLTWDNFLGEETKGLPYLEFDSEFYDDSPHTVHKSRCSPPNIVSECEISCTFDTTNTTTAVVEVGLTLWNS